MNPITWVILLVLVLPALGLLVWLWIRSSFVRIPTGSLGLLLNKGRPTDTALPPGAHMVPALRRKTVEEYPARELTLRAGDTVTPSSEQLEEQTPALVVTLGDRSEARVSYTVRFQLLVPKLKLVHERFGPQGLFGIVRDDSARAVRAVLSNPDLSVDDLFGKQREDAQQALAEAIKAELAEDGLDLTGFVLGELDLGLTGAVIQAASRSRHELEAEEAGAATRLARARNDADLAEQVDAAPELAWRYREPDLWRDLVQRTQSLNVALRTPSDTATVGFPSQLPSAGPDAQPGPTGEARP